ncbi:hypothetical protein LAZ67_2003284 [Cordylochernes scorpioides]|uniref:HAT C-terminal dimerisation domain-containing protein n=1 Tax=Cordylochernes scorpioides TaxID=51811 RepID=A0ABY6K3F6_9ARAC|nr:hypothetical protein LAZ67_2003284 [Cordylochernes scorpioides]
MVKDFSVKLLLRLKPLQEQMAEVRIQADNSQLPRSLQERHEPLQSNGHLTIERRLQEAIEAASSTSIAIPTPDSASYSTMINHELNIAAQSGKRGPHLESVYQYLLTIPPTSVESERVFSSSGYLCNKIRSTTYYEADKSKSVILNQCAANKHPISLAENKPAAEMDLEGHVTSQCLVGKQQIINYVSNQHNELIKKKSEETEKVETYKVNIKLPPFWIERPDIWFHQVEAQFLINNIYIKTENTKFNYIIAQLEPKYVEKLWDIITSKEINKYSEAKDRLLRIFKDGESKRIRKLLSGIELLQKLKSLATEDIR